METEHTKQSELQQTTSDNSFDEYIVDKALLHPFPQTEFQCEHFVAGSHATKYRQVRQVLLELGSRKHSLDKLHISVRKNELLIKQKEDKLAKAEDPYEKELLQIELDDCLLDRGQWQKRVDQAEIEIQYFLDYLKRTCGTLEETDKFFELNNEEEHKYWIARLAKQSSVDLLSTGRIQSGNVDAILMMGDEDQAATLNAAIRYAGAIDSGMERMKLSAEAEIKYMEGGVPSVDYLEQLGEQELKNKLLKPE